jgi:hypothetical protein
MDKAPGERVILTSARDGETAYSGQWDIETEDLRMTQKNPDRSALLRLVYRGSHAFAVLSSPAAKASAFFVRQDQMWLHSGNAGKDIRFDDDGRSYVTVREAGLFDLTHNPDDVMHELTVSPEAQDSEVYGFSFSDRCLDKDLP